MKKAKICIIAHNAYGALCGGKKGHIGGAEHQTSLMAKWFAAQGHESSLITWDEGQPDGESVLGVTVWKSCRERSGLPGVRFFHPRLTGLYAAMCRADAEVYYHNSAEYITGLAASWCKRHRRKFVYSAAAELACDIRLPLLKKPYERFLYRYGVRHAHLRVVQTQKQRQLFREGWGLPSSVLPMPCPGPSTQEFQASEPVNPPRVIWVGRVDSNKRLGWLFDIAERMPSVKFEVAGAINRASDVDRNLLQRAEKLANLRWAGSVAREKMPEFYRGATCLCCTSIHEGFPNVFIEAWSHGVPVVTTFDPDGLAARLRIGIQASDIDGLTGAIAKFCADQDRWSGFSRRARDYYLQNHQVNVAMERFQAEFNHLVICVKSNKEIIRHSGQEPVSEHSQSEETFLA